VQQGNVCGKSSFIPIRAGVVQGSVLDPLLFFILFNDLVTEITMCRSHVYAELYISSEPKDFEGLIRSLNLDLESITGKTQAMLINSSSNVPPVLLGSNQSQEPWNHHASGFNVELPGHKGLQKRLIHPQENRTLSSLIVLQYLFYDVLFSKSSAGNRNRLRVAWKSCARYMYGISRYQHITKSANRILG
jgi:hypothetical protein